MAAFTVWVTGPEMADVCAMAHQIEGRLRARALKTELLDHRTPGIEWLNGDGALAFLTSTLARHGIVSIVALPVGARSVRERARLGIDRFAEVYVPCPEAAACGYEPPDRPDVEVVLPKDGSGTGAARVITALEHLGFLDVDTHSASDVEDRAVRKRLKDFGYL